MGMFAQEPGTEAAGKRYQGVTKERGTRNLVIGFAAIVSIWYVAGRVQDHFLLQKQWPVRHADADGLTVIGTLDSRDYDHNLFRIVTANQTSRVELTDFGWNTIFNEKNGQIFRPEIGETIRSAQATDNETAYRILEPYLLAGVSMAMGKADWTNMVSASTPITIQVQQGKNFVPQNTTIGEQLFRFKSDRVKKIKGEDDASDASSGSGRQVDHGLPIPAESLIATCPVVLNSSDFTSADLEENPPNAFDPKTFTLRLNLTSEGRSRFFQWSKKHENESLVFVLKHRVAVTGRVKDAMDVTYWEVGPLHDEEMAKALADYVNKKSKN